MNLPPVTSPRARVAGAASRAAPGARRALPHTPTPRGSVTLPLLAFSLWTSDSGVATPLTVQWLRLRASTAGGACSVPGW